MEAWGRYRRLRLRPFRPRRPGRSSRVQTYQQNAHLFVAAVAQGIPAAEALAAFAHLSSEQRPVLA